VSNAAQDPLFTNSVTVYEARTGKVVAGPPRYTRANG